MSHGSTDCQSFVFVQWNVKCLFVLVGPHIEHEVKVLPG